MLNSVIFHTSLKVVGGARGSRHGAGQSWVVESHRPQTLSGSAAEAEQMNGKGQSL